MHTQADKTSTRKQQPAAEKNIRLPDDAATDVSFMPDNRTDSIQQKKMQAIADNSPQVRQLNTTRQMVDHFTATNLPLQKKANQTGLPDQLKSGIENLSGHSLDDVKVHYNSAKPTQLQAHAYAQGTDIHIAPGQEKHLAHEAWHVVQQKQGRVKPTMQMKSAVPVNDDPGLEREADIMGDKALNMAPSDSLPGAGEKRDSGAFQPVVQQQSAITQQVVQAKLKSGVLNVAGESHNEYDDGVLREKEKKLAAKKTGGSYWTESEFKVTEDDWWYGTKKGQSGDPILLQFLQALELVNSIGGGFIASMDPDNTEQAKQLRSMAGDCFRVLNGGVAERYSGVVDEFKKELISLSDEQRDAAGELGGKIKDMSTACRELYSGINDDGSLVETKRKIQQLQTTSTQLNKDIKRLGAVLNSGKAMSQENIRVPRSTKMHFSAQASFETPGIWKIGNNHYNDIAEYVKGTFVKAPKYNLLSKAEFNDERDKFNPDA